MTTNVVDGALHVMASDSRWSFPITGAGGAPYAVLYVDDTDFDKIELGDDYAMIFAGPALLMEKWKRWLQDPGRSVRKRPPVEMYFALCMVEVESRQIIFEHGQTIAGSDHRFAGTGALGAYTCWKQNRDPIKAVKSACIDDMYSGGEVRKLDLKSRKHNLKQSHDSKSINKQLVTNGVIMYTSQKQISVADAVKSDPVVKKAVKKIATGKVSAHAPAGLDPIVWTDADVKRLDDALEKHFGKK
jgi:hypothetical protein